ncbi:rhodanese-like domain-containing protein [Litoreibacter arenae]|uniref:Rhodanese domain-containing protein n=1 Tax=Litoreibacter arenae DSM 19593 TaxID=1123360 RepID=S9RI98_9RHOB|nr:rhodanese-like domain-containing protein [Litoreibacter arenae]EPX77835.1 hypothetical protein thalar_03562 [Litoreibacter arenae DSM 19593]
MKTENIEGGTLETWTPQEVQAGFERNEVVLIDVRTPQEFTFERIAGALLAPMQAFHPEHLPSEADKRLVLHCGSGARSHKVAEQCLKHGFTRIAHMGGGLAGWKDAGLRYTGTDMSTGGPKEMVKDG